MFDGKAYGEGIVELVKGYVEREVAPLKAENESLKSRIAELEARPTPEKGEKGEPGEPGKDGRDGANGNDGQNGKDAAGIVETLKDSGELVLTLEDGRLIRTGIRDGEKGADGRDGFGLDDFDVNPGSDGRTVILSFVQGEQRFETELKFPVVIDKGVYKTGNQYEPGDGVTWGGSYWIAQAKTNDKPDGPDSGWRLAVKKGRDGKDAK